MVLFRYLQYGFRDTMRSLWRHQGLVMVSVITVAIMLIVLGATVLLAANSEYMTDNMEEELEIIVFYDTAATRDEVLATEPYFQYITGFEQATFVSKEEAMEIMGEKLHQSNLTAATGGIIPGSKTGLISENLVSIPPEKSIMLSAIIPINCVSSGE
ncbi:MAG: hypothetical protein IJ936_04400, partial [Peptococcaceae bacterium]|nr:hypothetical protein [Peptococcaceae bacterium]